MIFNSNKSIFIIYSIKFDDSEYSIFNAFWYYLVYYILYGSFNILIKKLIENIAILFVPNKKLPS